MAKIDRIYDWLYVYVYNVCEQQNSQGEKLEKIIKKINDPLEQ